MARLGDNTWHNAPGPGDQLPPDPPEPPPCTRCGSNHDRREACPPCDPNHCTTHTHTKDAA